MAGPIKRVDMSHCNYFPMNDDIIFRFALLTGIDAFRQNNISISI